MSEVHRVISAWALSKQHERGSNNIGGEKTWELVEPARA